MCKDKEEKKKCVIKSCVKVAVLTEGSHSADLTDRVIESHQASDCICCGVGITYFSAELRFAAIL